MKRTIDQAFHLKNEWSDKVWRIKVFKTERNAKILVTYGRVGMMSRTTFLPVRSQFSGYIRNSQRMIINSGLAI